MGLICMQVSWALRFTAIHISQSVQSDIDTYHGEYLRPILYARLEGKVPSHFDLRIFPAMIMQWSLGSLSKMLNDKSK